MPSLAALVASQGPAALTAAKRPSLGDERGAGSCHQCRQHSGASHKGMQGLPDTLTGPWPSAVAYVRLAMTLSSRARRLVM